MTQQRKRNSNRWEDYGPPLTLEQVPDPAEVEHIMRHLRYSRNTVYKLLREGRIRVIGGEYDKRGQLLGRMARNYRISKAELSRVEHQGGM